METVEGTAEFVGLQALRTLSPEKYQRELDRYRALLLHPGPLLTDPRRMAYYTGALLLVSAQEAGLDLRHLLPGRACPCSPSWTGCSLTPHRLPCQLTPWTRRLPYRRPRITPTGRPSTVFLAQNPPYQEGPFRICGYDPMNQFAVDGNLFCTHFLALQHLATGSVHTLIGQSLLVLAPGSWEEALGVYHKKS